MKFETLRVFEDLKINRCREVGEVFEVTEARGKEILKNLPSGYVKVIKETSKKARNKEDK